MASNEILPFAADVSANVLSQSAYASDSQRAIGNQPGIARAQLNNKALRQLSSILAGFGQFLANRQGSNVTDSLSPSAVETVIQNALVTNAPSAGNIAAAGPAQGWWRKSSDGYIEQGISGIPVGSLGSHVDLTFPIPFTTVIMDIQCSVAGGASEQVGWALPTLTTCQVFTGTSDPSARIVNIVARGY